MILKVSIKELVAVEWGRIACDTGAVIRRREETFARLKIFDPSTFGVEWMVTELAHAIVRISMHGGDNEPGIEFRDS